MNFSPETWYVLGSIAATLLLQAAHARGLRVPLIEALLDWIARTRQVERPKPPRLSVTLPPDVPRSKWQPDIVRTGAGDWLLTWHDDTERDHG